MMVSVYIVCEYPHGPTDDVHEIKLVTTSLEEAKSKCKEFADYIEEHVVEVG